MRRPEIGVTVELVKADHFLSHYCNASVGSLGIVTHHSGLHPDDDGVLVDWGDGKPVRCGLDEIKTSTRIKRDNPMTSKTFKSALADSRFYVGVGRTLSGDVRISVASSSSRGLTTAIVPSDAPALCLAILEAAGVVPVQRDYESYDDGTPAHLQAVAYFLKQHNEAQERATAEARERAELEAEALELRNEYFGKECAWSDINNVGQALWLRMARKARELAKEATKWTSPR